MSLRYCFRRLLVLSLVLSAAYLLACDEDDPATVTPSDVTIAFLNWVGDPGAGGVPATLGELDLRYTSPFGAKYSLKTLRYIVSDVTLHRTTGETYGMGGIHYRDQEVPATTGFTLYDVPEGTYNMVSFTFGLDETKNIRGAYDHLGVDFVNAMAWPTGLGADLGYHYMKIEGNFLEAGDTTTGSFTTHTGARQCDGPCGPLGTVVDPVAFHHFFRVRIPLTATVINGGDYRVTINMDINSWYEDQDAGDGYDSGHNWRNLAMQLIMANLPEQNKLMTNGPHCFSASIASE